MSTPIPPSAPRSSPFDARPLQEPVDPHEVKRFHEELKRRFPGGGPNVVLIVVLCVFAVPILLGIVSTFYSVARRFLAAGLGLMVLPVMVALAALAVLLVVMGIRLFSGRRKERAYRLDRFARANAMHYLPRVSSPALPGMIFGRGSNRRASDIVRGERPRFVEFANYQYTTGSGKEQQTHRWGYVAIRLGTPLPHIVLDAVGNNGLFGSNLPAQFAKAQRLSLEGDFDRYFSLYCPEGYEADALYLFTPDVMARFIDNAAQLDVEIVDDWLFLYSGRPVSTLDPHTWAWLFSAVSAVMDKIAQWERWRDSRLAAAAAAPAVAGSQPLPFHTDAAVAPPTPTDWLGPKGVAEPGRRLKGGVSWVAIVIAVLLFGAWAFPMLSGILGNR